MSRILKTVRTATQEEADKAAAEAIAELVSAGEDPDNLFTDPRESEHGASVIDIRKLD